MVVLYSKMILQTQNYLEVQYIIQLQVAQKVKRLINSNSILVLWN